MLIRAETITQMSFKVGDEIIGNKNANEEYRVTRQGWKGIVTEINGNYFDAKDASGQIFYHLEEEYFDLINGSKAGKRGRPAKAAKPRPVNFLLKYDLDEDPIEEFETMAQVKERIDYLVQHERSLKRDSIIVYTVKKKQKVNVRTKITLHA